MPWRRKATSCAQTAFRFHSESLATTTRTDHGGSRVGTTRGALRAAGFHHRFWLEGTDALHGAEVFRAFGLRQALTHSAAAKRSSHRRRLRGGQRCHAPRGPPGCARATRSMGWACSYHWIRQSGCMAPVGRSAHRCSSAPASTLQNSRSSRMAGVQPEDDSNSRPATADRRWRAD